MKLLNKFFKTCSQTKITSDKYPVIGQVEDLAFQFNYEYDTVYEVYLEWDKDINVTENVFLISSIMSSIGGTPVYPWDITKKSMTVLSECFSNYGVTCEEVANSFKNLIL